MKPVIKYNQIYTNIITVVFPSAMKKGLIRGVAPLKGRQFSSISSSQYI
jgi:hypothetical protein